MYLLNSNKSLEKVDLEIGQKVYTYESSIDTMKGTNSPQEIIEVKPDE